MRRGERCGRRIISLLRYAEAETRGTRVKVRGMARACKAGVGLGRGMIVVIVVNPDLADIQGEEVV